MGIGAIIRDYRKQRGLTLKELSEQIGVSSSFLSAVEREIKKPSVALVKRISDVLSISPTYLLGMGTEKIHGDKLRFIRKGRSMSVAELSELTGIPAEDIEAYEAGNREPDLDTLEQLADALGVTVRFFFEKSADSFSIGNRIRVEREKKGLTRAQLAASAGISPAMVSQLESNQAEPSLDTLESISQALGVSICYFLLEQEDVENLLASLNAEVLNLLGDPRVQAVLRAVRDLDAGELKYILNYIQFFKRNLHLLKK